MHFKNDGRMWSRCARSTVTSVDSMGESQLNLDSASCLFVLTVPSPASASTGLQLLERYFLISSGMPEKSRSPSFGARVASGRSSDPPFWIVVVVQMPLFSELADEFTAAPRAPGRQPELSKSTARPFFVNESTQFPLASSSTQKTCCCPLGSAGLSYGFQRAQWSSFDFEMSTVLACAGTASASTVAMVSSATVHI